MKELAPRNYPSKFERLRLASEARQRMVEHSRALEIEQVGPVFEAFEDSPLSARLPEPVKRLLQAGFAGLALTLLAAACEAVGDDEKPESIPTSAPRAERRVEQLEQERFLALPLEANSQMKIQQGWIYRNGGEHQAVDYIKGQLDDSSTWQSFPVLAAAAGEACLNPPNSQGDAVFIRHRVDRRTYYTYYGHLRQTATAIPECSSGERINVGQGQRIGEAGATGLADQRLVHLHFEVKDMNDNPIDPYDIYARRSEYPDILFKNGRVCGPRTLWVNCPTAALAEQPPVNLIPTFTPIPQEQETREQMIARKKMEAKEKARRFVDLVSSGFGGNILEAFQMQVPDEARSDLSRRYQLASVDQLQVCSQEMIRGEFQNVSYTQWLAPRVELTETEKLNIERGLAPRDRYKLGVNFTYRDYNSNIDRRGPFVDYDAIHFDTFLVFEDVEGGLLIAENRLCLAIGSPLQRVWPQYE